VEIGNAPDAIAVENAADIAAEADIAE